MGQKDKILFLLKRWNGLLIGAASQTVYNKAISKDGNKDLVPKNIHCIIDTIGHIDNIKKKIVDIIPKCSFIEKEYNPGIDLTDNDLTELYIKHNRICIEKVMNLVNTNRIK